MEDLTDFLYSTTGVQGTWWFLEFATALTNVTSIEFNTEFSCPGGVIKLNGTDVAVDQSNIGSGYVTVSVTGTIPSSLTEIAVQGYSGSARLKWVKINGKYLFDPGVIPADSLTSTLYNQDQVWSNFLSSSNGFSGSYTADQAFNGVLDTGGGSATNGTGGVMTFAPTSALSVSTMDIRVYSDTTITFPDSSTVAVSGQQSDLGWISVNLPSSFTGFTGSNSITLHNTNGGLQYFDGFRINGKILANSNVSLSVPSMASTVRANPTAGFSIVSYTGYWNQWTRCGTRSQPSS